MSFDLSDIDLHDVGLATNATLLAARRRGRGRKAHTRIVGNGFIAEGITASAGRWQWS